MAKSSARLWSSLAIDSRRLRCADGSATKTPWPCLTTRRPSACKERTASRSEADFKYDLDPANNPKPPRKYSWKWNGKTKPFSEDCSTALDFPAQGNYFVEMTVKEGTSEKTYVRPVQVKDILVRRDRRFFGGRRRRARFAGRALRGSDCRLGGQPLPPLEVRRLAAGRQDPRESRPEGQRHVSFVRVLRRR